MKNMIMPATEQRSNFLRGLDAVASMLGLNSAEAVQKSYKVYDDTLILPGYLSPSQSSYSFDPTKAVDTPIPTENKLDKNDWFIVTGVGLRFQKVDYDSATGLYSNHGNYFLHTFPYASVFAGAAAGGNKSEADALLTAIRGTLALNVNNDQQFALPCSELVYADQNFSAGFPVYGSNAGQRGIFDLSSLIILSGGVDNKVVVNLAPGNKAVIDGSVSGATTRNLIVPVLQGIRIKNTAGGRYIIDNCKA
jgi:hypothetical protein